MEIEVLFNVILQILVENMGCINYGSEIVYNIKGIISLVQIVGKEIVGGWDMYQLLMDEMFDLIKLKVDIYKNVLFEVVKLKGCLVFYEGIFMLDKVGDIFMDMESWGKGIVFVNGVNIGCYWKVGFQ